MRDFRPDEDDDSQFPPLNRGKSLALMDTADEFATKQAKREKPILINVAIDQQMTVADLMK